MSDLDRLADGCSLLSRARVLAGWVGAGRPVTPKGVLRPGEVSDVAAALGVEVPAKVRSAADVEAIHRPWVAAAAVGWLRVSANRAVATGSAGGEPLDRWWAAVDAVLRAESHDDRGRGASVLCHVLLTALDIRPSQAPGELSDVVDDLLDDVGPGDVTAVYSAFRRGVMPVDAGVELLSEIGAVDDTGRMTVLGRWLRQRLEAEFPPPVSPDLSAAVLLDRLATLPDDEVWRQAGRWLVDRDLGKAADELLSAASVAWPAQRLAAVAVVAGLGGPAGPAWQRALADPILAPHARLVLAQFDEDADDDAEESEPSDADRRWLAVESTARLGGVLPRVGATMTYVYDLGDWWEHRITVERIIDGGDPDATAVCVGGQGDAPAEDWFPGCGRNPTKFDIAEINRHLAGEEEPVGS